MEQKYVVYKQVKSKEEFFTTWNNETFENLTEQLKEYIYKKYLIKCNVFQRDNFQCQNLDCQTPNSPLTIHHIKWQKNGGGGYARRE